MSSVLPVELTETLILRPHVRNVLPAKLLRLVQCLARSVLLAELLRPEQYARSVLLAELLRPEQYARSVLLAELLRLEQYARSVLLAELLRPEQPLAMNVLPAELLRPEQQHARKSASCAQIGKPTNNARV